MNDKLVLIGYRSLWQTAPYPEIWNFHELGKHPSCSFNTVPVYVKQSDLDEMFAKRERRRVAFERLGILRKIQIDRKTSHEQ